MTRQRVGPEFWALIRPHTGDLAEVRPTTRGFASDVTSLVSCTKGPFFVKAMRNRPGGRRDQMIRERVINPFVRAVAPALRWEAEDEEWIVLGFEVVDGRRSDFTADSADLPAVVGLLNRIGELDLPEVARDWPETRWDRFADDASQAERFRGDALLHGDINPSNFMIGERNTWAVDWSWPTRGAAFIDPAALVVQFVSAGHSPAAAEAWAAHCPAWTGAHPGAVDAFAAATVRMHQEIVRRRPEEQWRKAMLTAARSWAAHRGVAVG